MFFLTMQAIYVAGDHYLPFFNYLFTSLIFSFIFYFYFFKKINLHHVEPV